MSELVPKALHAKLRRMVQFAVAFPDTEKVA